jgi:2-polyprenyl-3-methyl-5-hydroxy-6-metoxy-1,4-benzoquinol methylase
VISYGRQTVNAANPLARYAHRARISMGLTLAERHCARGATVLDFGAGPGLFLHRLGAARPDLTLIGFDPYMAPQFSEIQYMQRLDQLGANSVDLFTAFEVCEHLYKNEFDTLLDELVRVIAPDGAIVISVPIMYGVAVVPKVLNWKCRDRTAQTGYSWGEVLRSAVGMPVRRPENLRITHKGFDFRKLRATFGARFVLERVYHCPILWMPWWLSSQFFMVCRKAPSMRPVLSNPALLAAVARGASSGSDAIGERG